MGRERKMPGAYWAAPKSNLSSNYGFETSNIETFSLATYW